MYAGIQPCPHSSTAKGVEASEHTHIIRFPSNTPQIFSFKQKKAVGESDYLVVKPSNKCLSRAFMVESKDAWRSGATMVKLHKLNSRAVKTERDGDTKTFPLFLGNNEHILQSDYSVTPAGPALKSVLGRGCSYLLSD